jgi:hypothetical protein
MSELSTDQRSALDWLIRGNTGISSKALAYCFLGGDPGKCAAKFSPPSDPSDLGRCLQLIECVPAVPGSISQVNGEIWKAELEKAQRRVGEQSDRLVEISRVMLREVVDDTVGKLTRLGSGEQKRLSSRGIDQFREFLATFRYRNFMDDEELAGQVRILEGVMQGIRAEELKDSPETRERVQARLREASAAIDTMITEAKSERMLALAGEGLV